MKRVLPLSSPLFALAVTIAGTGYAQAPAGPGSTQQPAQAAPAPNSVGERVAAVVNDYPISTFDIRQRMRLMIATQGAQVPEEAMAQFQEQALRDLIDERLKLQEADRWDLVVDEGEIDEEIARIAASGGGTIETLARDLAQQGIDLVTLREKIRAETAWERLVRGRYGPRVNVTESEVEDYMADLRADTQQPQFLISEICLPMTQPDDAERMFGVGMELIDRMRQGVPFRALAQRFSACPTAARGGDLGWMKENDMDPEIAELVTRLATGNISRPVPHDGMMKLLALRQRRDVAEAGEPAYTVAYAGAPISVGLERAEEMAEQLPLANPCAGASLSIDLGPDVGVTVLPMLKENQFESVFHDVLANLEEGETSDVIESEGAYHVVYLCEKDEGLGLPSRRVVENRLEAEELDRLSRRYLRDVERDSAVEIRLSQGG